MRDSLMRRRIASLFAFLVLCAAYAAYAADAAPACFEDEFRAAIHGRRVCIPYDDIRP